VRTNTRLYEVDESRVYLLDGTIPAYRALGPGTDGGDVRALETNLRALGMDPGGAMTVDGEWDGGTTAAVKRWQDSHGLAETGTIELGRVVFAPGNRRVAELAVDVGASTGSGSGGSGADAGSGAEVMTTTSTRRIVTVKLDTTKSAVAKRSARVSVELPSGAIAHGRILRVAKTAEQATNADGQPDGAPTVELTIVLSGRATAIDQAPVSVRLELSRARDVLAIPVTALLARSGGRFAVEVVEGERRRLVAVTTGLFTSGYVAIEGSGLRPGMRVANAAV
jgi:peptidoglycan hydrolase-like protein with peptidoglycan-binding domain